MRATLRPEYRGVDHQSFVPPGLGRPNFPSPTPYVMTNTPSRPPSRPSPLSVPGPSPKTNATTATRLAAQAEAPVSGTTSCTASPQEGATSATGKKRGRAAGSSNFSVDDVQHLLEAVRDVKPLGQHGWAMVAQLYNSTWAEPNYLPSRGSDSLKVKFTKLYSTKIPDDPQATLPPQVQLAKDIHSLLEAAAHQDQLQYENDTLAHDFVEDDEGSVYGDDTLLSDDEAHPPPVAKRARIVPSATATNPSSSGGSRHRSAPRQSIELKLGQVIDKLGYRLDPPSRPEERRAERSVAIISSLQSEVSNSNFRIMSLERKIDHLQCKLEEANEARIKAEQQAMKAELTITMNSQYHELREQMKMMQVFIGMQSVGYDKKT